MPVTPDPLPNIPNLKLPTPTYRLRDGTAYTQKMEGPWTEAEITMVPPEAEGGTDAVGIVHIDGVRCIVFAAPDGRYFAQMEHHCRVVEGA